MTHPDTPEFKGRNRGLAKPCEVTSKYRKQKLDMFRRMGKNLPPHKYNGWPMPCNQPRAEMGLKEIVR